MKTCLFATVTTSKKFELQTNKKMPQIGIALTCGDQSTDNHPGGQRRIDSRECQWLSSRMGSMPTMPLHVVNGPVTHD
jgi:hypothetical protein